MTRRLAALCYDEIGTSSVIRKLIRHTVPAVLKPLHILWNQVIGFFFLAFAAMGFVKGYSNFREFDGDLNDVAKVALPAVWVLVMGFFGIVSFLKARKISRS